MYIWQVEHSNICGRPIMRYGHQNFYPLVTNGPLVSVKMAILGLFLTKSCVNTYSTGHFVYLWQPEHPHICGRPILRHGHQNDYPLVTNGPLVWVKIAILGLFLTKSCYNATFTSNFVYFRQLEHPHICGRPILSHGYQNFYPLVTNGPLVWVKMVILGLFLTKSCFNT